MSGVQALLFRTQVCLLNDLVRNVCKNLSGLVVGGDQNPKIMQRLLADVGFKVVDVKGMLPPDIELQGAQHGLIAQIEMLFENAKPGHDGHRHVGSAIVRAI